MKSQNFLPPDTEQYLFIATGGAESAQREISDQYNDIVWIRPADVVRGRYPLSPAPVMGYPSTIEQMVSDFSQKDLGEGCQALQALLSGVVAEYDTGQQFWEYYTCGVAIMPCCIGEYMRIVNRKELQRPL